MKLNMPKLSVGLMLAILALPVWAASGAAQLQQFFTGLKTMRADFIQSVVDAEGNVLEESEGVLLLSRPDRFRLEYRSPYEQLYIADGKRVWMYDRDLEQVTVKAQGNALGNTPALLLSSTEPLEKNFTIKELGLHEGMVWLELTPRRDESSFEYIRLALEEGRLRAMEMVDGFGQTTRLYFADIRRNAGVSEDSFRFQPPAGVDVISDE